jgi:thiamine pyrophosphokinase
VIFVNGKVDDPRELERWLAPGDYLVGADGGTRHLLALGLHPHVVVGDLDSLDPATVADLQAASVEFERHRRDKDQTDLELAVQRALRAGADEILLLGALGGRLDQALANVLLLARGDWPAPIRLVQGDQVAQVLQGPGRLELTLPLGSTVSVVPISAEVVGITYEGLLYPLRGATLSLGSTRGVSNEVVGQPVTIAIDRGTLLVIWSAPADIGVTSGRCG